MSDDDNIRRLPIKFRGPPGEGETLLKIVEPFGSGACNHRSGYVNGKVVSAHYLIREGDMDVTCSLCSGRVDPMFVLKILAKEETKWQHNRERYRDEMNRLAERKRTTCEHCGKMTRISRP